MIFLKIFFVSLLLIAGPLAKDNLIENEERELKIKTFPCMSCHDSGTKLPSKFPLLTPHNKQIFNHHDNIKNCYSCHNAENKDQLVLQTGEKISFNDSQRLCFQCHGEKKRDWELGTHGKTIGSWNGKKYKYTCTNCHNPHSPPFRKMKADPGPVHPQKNKNSGAH